MAIPKIIHLCWFGGRDADDTIKSCLTSIHRLAEDGYEVRIWNEDNYDTGKSQATRRAYENKKWSLVSNYARVDVLNRFGGIYLDTDIEVIRNFDDLLDEDFFAGFVWDCLIGTAVIGCAPGHPIVKGILDRYESDIDQLISPNNNTFTEHFLQNVSGFALDGRDQLIDGVRILDKHAFEHPSLFRRKNYTVHHFAQSWRPGSSLKRTAKSVAIRTMSLWLYRKYVCWNSRRISEFYPRYRAARGLSPARSA